MVNFYCKIMKGTVDEGVCKFRKEQAWEMAGAGQKHSTYDACMKCERDSFGGTKEAANIAPTATSAPEPVCSYCLKFQSAKRGWNKKQKMHLSCVGIVKRQSKWSKEGTPLPEIDEKKDAPPKTEAVKAELTAADVQDKIKRDIDRLRREIRILEDLSKSIDEMVEEMSK